jgi:hypothetical protein
MSQNYSYPSGSQISVPAVGTNGTPIPTSSILVAGKGPTALLTPVSVDAAGVVNTNVLTLPAITGTVIANQGTPNIIANAWPVKLTDGTLSNTFTANGLKVDGSAVTQPVSGTFFQATQPISAAALPLPAGASTSALQTSLNALFPTSIGQKTAVASLAVVLASDQTLPLPTGSATAANQTTQISQFPATLGAKVSTGSLGVVLASDQAAIPVSQSGTWNLLNITGTVSLPTGASTSALQTATNASLASIDTKTPALGQALAAASVPVVLTAAQLTALTPSALGAPGGASGNSPGSTTVSTAATITAPANAMGFVLMNLDTSTANVRYRIGGTAAAANGQQLQPGRDTGFIPCKANISICAESGTQNYDIQWVIQ